MRRIQYDKRSHHPDGNALHVVCPTLFAQRLFRPGNTPRWRQNENQKENPQAGFQEAG